MRALGKGGATKALNAFAAKQQARLVDGLIGKIETLPKINGQPDLGQLGDPNKSAKRLIAELRIDSENWVERLMAHLKEPRQS